MSYHDNHTDVDILPKIDGERCVHAYASFASCSRCVSTCPKDALKLDQSALTIDVNACDGCGLCSASCPENAIDNGTLWRRQLDAHAHLSDEEKDRFNEPITLFLACECVGLKLDDLLISCLDSFGIEDLKIVADNGVSRLVVSCGDCENCDRYIVEGRRLKGDLEIFNLLLQSRGSPKIQWIENDRRSFAKHFLHYKQKLLETNVTDRRGFFRHIIKRTQDVSSDYIKESENVANNEFGTAMPKTDNSMEVIAINSDSIYHVVPVIDARLCVGCDTCIRVCPHSALSIINQDGKEEYRINAGDCTGCGLCVDICDQSAISLSTWTSQLTTSIMLDKCVCNQCGVSFHRPVESHEEISNQCRICKNHASKGLLYQVFN